MFGCRRIAERRERTLKRLQLTSSTTNGDGGGQPTSCQEEKSEDSLHPLYLNRFYEILEVSSRHLDEFKGENEAFSGAPFQADQLVFADLCGLLREAAARLEDESDELEESFFKLQSVKNPTTLRAELEILTRQAAAAERAAAQVEATAASLLENKASHFVQILERQAKIVQKAISSVESECIATAAVMAEHASATETALLQQLAKGHETRQAAIAAEIKMFRCLEAKLHDERVNKRQAQEKALEEMRKNEHAGHDELWHELSRQATELALELSLEKHARLFTADKLGYNVRVLRERNKENKEVLTELQRNVHKQKALLAGLRSEYAEEKSSASAAQDKFKKDAEHALQSLNSLKDKALHFEIADREELRQLVVFKEERLAKMLEKLIKAEKEISQLCELDYLSYFGGVKVSPRTGVEEARIDDALKKAYWRDKLNNAIPEGLHAELKRLEAAIRQDLQ